MHKAGLSKAQAHQVARAYQDEHRLAAASMEKRWEQERDILAAKGDPAELEAAKRAVRLSGATREQIKWLERLAGPLMLTKLLSNIGKRIMEDRPPGAAEGQGVLLSAKAAKDKIISMTRTGFISEKPMITAARCRTTARL
jgi:hypothetical protein